MNRVAHRQVVIAHGRSAAAHRRFASERRRFAAAHRRSASESRRFAAAHRRFASESCRFATAHRRFASESRRFATAHRRFASESRRFAAENRRFTVAHRRDSGADLRDTLATSRCAVADWTYDIASCPRTAADGGNGGGNAEWPVLTRPARTRPAVQQLYPHSLDGSFGSSRISDQVFLGRGVAHGSSAERLLGLCSVRTKAIGGFGNDFTQQSSACQDALKQLAFPS